MAVESVPLGLRLKCRDTVTQEMVVSAIGKPPYGAGRVYYEVVKPGVRLRGELMPGMSISAVPGLRVLYRETHEGAEAWLRYL